MTFCEQGSENLSDSAGQVLSVPLILQLPMHRDARGTSPLTGINQCLGVIKEKNDPFGLSVCTKS